MSKERLDVLLVNKGLATSREKAKAIIMSGNVYVDGQKEDKAGQSFPDTAVIEVRGTTLKYVSRGGLKLEKAMQNFDVTLEGKICMDVGSSTGGFTDHSHYCNGIVSFWDVYRHKCLSPSFGFYVCFDIEISASDFFHEFICIRI